MLFMFLSPCVPVGRRREPLLALELAHDGGLLAVPHLLGELRHGLVGGTQQGAGMVHLAGEDVIRDNAAHLFLEPKAQGRSDPAVPFRHGADRQRVQLLAGGNIIGDSPSG